MSKISRRRFFEGTGAGIVATAVPLKGQPAAKAGEAAVEGANPLAKNGYKIPLTRAVVRRTLLELANRA